MASLVFAVLLLVMAGQTSANWCVCKQGVSESVLQKALDYACGAGADCNPIHQSGACFNPNTVLAHCNFAVNSYFQRKGQTPGSCEFAGASTVTASDPSITGCAYPSSASTAGTSGSTPFGGTTTNTPTSVTPVGGSPYMTAPGNGVLGGVGTGLAPTGAGFNDDSFGGITNRQNLSIFTSLVTIVLTVVGICW